MLQFNSIHSDNQFGTLNSLNQFDSIIISFEKPIYKLNFIIKFLNNFQLLKYDSPFSNSPAGKADISFLLPNPSHFHIGPSRLQTPAQASTSFNHRDKHREFWGAPFKKWWASARLWKRRTFPSENLVCAKKEVTCPEPRWTKRVKNAKVRKLIAKFPSSKIVSS